jgi:hypothetical protein
MSGVATCIGAYLLLSYIVGRTFWLGYSTWKGPRR